MTNFRMLMAALLAAPVALALAGPAAADPLGGARVHQGATPIPGVELVGHGGIRFGGGGHFGGPGHFHGRYFGGFGPGIAFGVPYYGYGYGPAYFDDGDDDYYVADEGPEYGDDPVARCQARYRSFDAESGTFLGYDGERHPCPYL